ncbi:DegT/DnrJ/EryC1/StrS family aminotransferase [Winogradskyella sp. 3972H.M.0a.05]|uniref:DegT/DnrJ/EryC1/StrS family aminotransferase n=1 Tax=Winogradskyella sp. 3972H.M.0a.05 TaxID=2950277 RepID=UPI003393C867
MKERIWLSPPDITGKELDYIKDAFSSNWIAPIGPHLNKFEETFESLLGHNKYTVALNSGTAAIHIALRLLNVGNDDEVICQTKTFIGSVNPVLYVGAKPIFVDSELESWNMCPELLDNAIKDRLQKTGKLPKAIIMVCIYGMPYKVEDIHAVAESYGIPVIEDSAEALGSTYNNRQCGTFGDMSIFSFNGNKIITTSGGGLLIVNSEAEKTEAIKLSTQYNSNPKDYTHDKIGYNYRLSNVLAGIGLGQLEQLDEKVAKKQNNYKAYRDAFEEIEAIHLQPELKGSFSNRWLNCILVDSAKSKSELMQLFEDNNIEVKSAWKPMHLQPVFKDYPNYTNGISEDLYNRGICLPSGTSLSEEDLNRITNLVTNYYQC